MIPMANLPLLLSGLPVRIDPRGGQAAMLMESLPDEFWTRLEAVDSGENERSALEWGRDWIRDNWRTVLGGELFPDPYPPLKARRNDQGQIPLSPPSGPASEGSPGSPATAQGLPADTEEPGLGCPDEMQEFNDDLTGLLSAVQRLLDHLGNPEETTPWWRKTTELRGDVIAQMENLAQWADSGEDPIRDGWVDSRGLP